jgi:hypothetical protein
MQRFCTEGGSGAEVRPGEGVMSLECALGEGAAADVRGKPGRAKIDGDVFTMWFIAYRHYTTPGEV